MYIATVQRLGLAATGPPCACRNLAARRLKQTICAQPPIPLNLWRSTLRNSRKQVVNVSHIILALLGFHIMALTLGGGRSVLSSNSLALDLNNLASSFN